jgi:hypothetical protein
VAFLGFAALAVVLLREAVLSGRVFFQRDIHMWWLPRMESFVRCLHAGSWPVWDPWRALGQPFLADPSGEVYYPFTWLNLLFSPGTTYTLFVLGHWLISALGLYVLARRWGTSTGGAFVAAAIWMASPLVAMITLAHHLAGAAWMPWVVAAALRAAAAEAPVRHAVACGLLMGVQILAGSADMVAMTWGVAALGIAFHHRHRGALRAAAVAAAVALGLSAAQWWPTLDMAAGAERFEHAEKSRTTWSVHPLSLLEVIVPLRWFALPLRPDVLESVTEAKDPWLTTLYLGVPVLALVAAAFVPAGASRRALWLVVGLSAVLVALGRHAPFYGWLMAVVPPLKILRFPVKAMVVGALAWSMLAGLGWDVWRTDAGTARRWLVRVVPVVALGALLVAVAALAAVGAGPVMTMLREGAVVPMPTRLRLALGAVIALVVAGLAVARTRGLGRGRSSPLAVSVGALALASLVGAHLWIETTADPETFRYRPPVLEWIRPGSRVYVQDYSFYSRGEMARGVRKTSPYRVARLPAGASPGEALMLGAHAYLNPPTAARWGVRGSYDLDMLGLYDPWLARLTEAIREAEGTPRHLRLLQVAGVEHVLALRDAADWSPLTPVATVPGFFELPIRVFRVPDPLPFAYAVGRAEVAADFETSLARITDPAFDARRSVLLADGAVRPPADGFRGEVEVLLHKPDRWRLRTDFSAPGYVVLLEAYDRGWRASVDGRAAPMRRANLVFRAVEVPAGAHVVEMVYRPGPVVAGAAISILTLLSSAGVFGLWRRADR